MNVLINWLFDVVKDSSSVPKAEIMSKKENYIVLKKCIPLVLLLVSTGLVSARKDVMKDIILGYGEALEICREEANVGPELLGEFYHAWDKDYVMVHREIGCALLCMSHHHELLHDDKNLNHDNVGEYVTGFNEGHVLEDLIVDMTTKCEEPYIDMEDHCARTVKIFNCFKARAFAEGIAPKFEMK